MPFGEVMYRCNAHYCFSVFRNRVAGLLTTLALMQLFLFSFYLNGLHSQTVVTHNDISGYQQKEVMAAVPEVATDLRARGMPEEEGQLQGQGQGREDEAPPAVTAAPATAVPPGRPNYLVNQLTDLLRDPTKSKVVGDAAKKALDSVMTNKADLQIPLQLMQMAASAAKKLPSTADQAAMTKIGLDLLVNTFNADAKTDAKGGAKEVNDVSKYTDMAKMGLQMLGNGKGLSVLDAAAQFVGRQDLTSQQASAKSAAFGLLSGALSNQKMDPRVMFGVANMAAKVLQSQQQQPSQANDLMASINLLSKLMPAGGRLAPAMVDARSSSSKSVRHHNQSEDIYTDYVRHTVQRLNLDDDWSTAEPKLDPRFTVTNSCPPAIDAVVVVVSTAAAVDRRQAARQSWAAEVRRSQRLSVVFIVGSGEGPSPNHALLKESRTYGDVIRVAVDDSASNTTLKSVAALQWVRHNCPQVKLVLKCDDDVFVNPDIMLAIIDAQQDQSVLLGNQIQDADPHDTKDLRHVTDTKLWPWDRYPTFLSGGAYLIGNQAVVGLLEAVQSTPIFPVEDVYITGLCALGARLQSVDHQSFFSDWLAEEIDECTFADYASWRTTGAKDLLQTWKLAQKIKKSGQKCSRTKRCAVTVMGLCLPSS